MAKSKGSKAEHLRQVRQQQAQKAKQTHYERERQKHAREYAELEKQLAAARENYRKLEEYNKGGWKPYEDAYQRTVARIDLDRVAPSEIEATRAKIKQWQDRQTSTVEGFKKADDKRAAASKKTSGRRTENANDNFWDIYNALKNDPDLQRSIFGRVLNSSELQEAIKHMVLTEFNRHWDYDRVMNNLRKRQQKKEEEENERERELDAGMFFKSEETKPAKAAASRHRRSR